MAKNWVVASTVDGKFNYATVCKSLKEARAEFREWLKEHDDNPEGREFDDARLVDIAKGGYYDDGSGYIITLTQDSVDFK